MEQIVQTFTQAEFDFFRKNGWIDEDGCVTPAGRAALFNGDVERANQHVYKVGEVKTDA